MQDAQVKITALCIKVNEKDWKNILNDRGLAQKAW